MAKQKKYEPLYMEKKLRAKLLATEIATIHDGWIELRRGCAERGIKTFAELFEKVSYMEMRKSGMLPTQEIAEEFTGIVEYHYCMDLLNLNVD